MSLSSTTPHEPYRFPHGGEPPIAHPAVCEADPSNPPPMPSGTTARAITNAEGTVILFVMVAPGVAEEIIDERCYDFMDRYEAMTRTHRPRLVKG